MRADGMKFRGMKFRGWIVVALGMVLGMRLLGQILHADGPAPSFEVATIKPMEPMLSWPLQVERRLRVGGRAKRRTDHLAAGGPNQQSPTTLRPCVPDHDREDADRIRVQAFGELSTSCRSRRFA